MDRQIVFPGAIPLDTDLLNVQREVMIALGYLAQATLGGTTIADGLACTPGAPTSLSVTIGPGSILAMQVIDANGFGSLPARASEPLAKLGIVTTPTNFTLSAPATSGQSINYLIEAAFQETDATPVVLPYYNAANPAVPFSGPGNSGSAQNTQRLQQVQFQLKAGVAATTGAQATPAIDTGWTGLYVITVAYGQTQILPANIATHPTSPLLQYKLPALVPGFCRQAIYASSGSFTWTVPPGVTQIRLRAVGGGGGGGATLQATAGASGGSAGGYAEGIFPVAPGQQLALQVGAAGLAGGSGGNGGDGGTTSVAGLLTAAGGQGGIGTGAATNSGCMPALGGSASGGSINVQGASGQAAFFINGSYFGGNGASTCFGAGGREQPGAGGNAFGNGAGGGGGCQGQAGGAGTPGMIVIEY